MGLWLRLLKNSRPFIGFERTLFNPHFKNNLNPYQMISNNGINPQERLKICLSKLFYYVYFKMRLGVFLTFCD
ncbi:hypothetical protein HMPREF1415_01076 [Helicobacter pylori GAM254Ai]|nr:hypothetical protein HMPREF1415_01076 [Helicobacter pylori GAM254Ai]